MTPSCESCGQPLSDPRGCLPQGGEALRYGDELHPMSFGDTCRDCGVGRGGWHHPGCAMAECPRCHRQDHRGISCDEDAELTTGSSAA